MSPATLRAEIARLTRQRNEWNILGWSDWDSDAEIAGQIADLEEALYVAEHPEEYAADLLPLSSAA